MDFDDWLDVLGLLMGLALAVGQVVVILHFVLKFW